MVCILPILCLLALSVELVHGARTLQAGAQTLTGQISAVAKDYFLKDVPPGRDFFLEIDGQDSIQLNHATSGLDLWTTLYTGQIATITGNLRKPADRGPVMDITSVHIDRQPNYYSINPASEIMNHSNTASTNSQSRSPGRSLLQAPTTTALPVSRANMNTLIIPMSFQGCPRNSAQGGGTYPALPYTKADIQTFAFGALDETTSASLTQSYNKCSYGKAYLNTSNSVVAGIVQIPCKTGTDRCSATDTWADYAVQGAISQGINVNNYGYRVFIIPPNSNCDWKGFGTVNCNPSSFYKSRLSTGLTNCRSWVNGGFYRAPMVAMHEQGHNLGLAHSATITSTFSEIEDYGDRSSLMGYCHDGSPDKQCVNRCYNQAHSWQLGWSKPLLYNSTSLSANTWVSVTFNSLLRSDQSGVKILTSTWTGTTSMPVYLGYRIAESIDTPLSLVYPEYFNKTNVYLFSGASNTDYKQPGWLAALGNGERYTVQNSGGLTIRQDSFNNAGGTVTVSICRGTCA